MHYDDFQKRPIFNTIFDTVTMTYNGIDLNSDSSKMLLEHLGFTFNDITPLEFALHGYAYGVLLGENVFLFYGSKRGSSNHNENGSTILLHFTGQGCLEMTKRGLDFVKFLEFSMFQLNANFTRIDFASDVINSNLFSFNTLVRKVRKRELTTNRKFKTARIIENLSLENDNSLGTTIYLGSVHSDRQACIYEKDKERLYRGYDITNDIKKWIRFELRFKRKKTNDIIYNLILQTYNGLSLNEFVSSLWLECLDFKIKSKTDTNKSRWLTCSWWTKTLNTFKTFELVNQYELESKITMKKRISYAYKTYPRLIQEIYLCNPFDFNNFLLNIINDFNKITNKEMARINAYRIDKNLSVITKNDVEKLLKLIKKGNEFIDFI